LFLEEAPEVEALRFATFSTTPARFLEIQQGGASMDSTEQTFSSSSSPSPNQPGPETTSSSTKKFSTALAWTPDLAKTHYVAVVRGFLEHYSSLNPPITTGEAMFVIHVMSYKWGADAPYPGYKTIAKLMGVSDKMARRHAQSLEQKHYLVRQLRRANTNKFDFQQLFAALEKKVQEAAPRRRRKSQLAA
jgi:hypothetical protein